MSEAELDLIRSIADDLPVGVWVARAPGGELLYANRTFGEIMGMGARDDVAAGGYAEPYGICGTDGAPYPEEEMPFVRALRSREVVVVDDIVIRRRDGTRVPVRAHARPVIGAGGEVSHVAIVFFDITKEVEARAAQGELTERLRQGEKMQAIGQLAAGLAHDFNNVLAAVRVLGSRLGLDERDPLRRELLRQLDAAAESGAGLARQLLELGGSGRARRSAHSLRDLVRAVGGLLARTIGGRIEVRLEDDGSAARVDGVLSQLEQVVLNLALNARDAMGEPGGVLTIATRTVSVDGESAARRPPLAAGEHVVLEVSDTGPGIPEAIRGRIFEPYFTTKSGEERRGRGLGLATVYGIVRAHGGAIEVLDAVPRGATLRVWLPAAREGAAGVGERAAEAARYAPRVAPGTRSGTVLFVDDESALRASCGAGLEQLGYEVLLAEGGEAAIERVGERGTAIVVVLLDLVMPGMDGAATFDAIRAIDGELPVVLTTGTPFDPDIARMQARGRVEVLPKPYDLDQLAAAIERVRRDRAPR